MIPVLGAHYLELAVWEVKLSSPKLNSRSQVLALAYLLGITVQEKNGISFSIDGVQLSSTEMNTPSGGKETVPGHLHTSAYICYVWM